jgi:drug/metabolite transporter (DMT)-like permease
VLSLDCMHALQRCSPLHAPAAPYSPFFHSHTRTHRPTATGEGWAETFTVLNAIFFTPVCLSVVLWIGLGPGALAAFLQARGQAAVPASQAQLIYATCPLWTTLVARLTLDARDEAMGLVAWAGAGLMLGASLLASMGPGGVLARSSSSGALASSPKEGLGPSQSLRSSGSSGQELREL